MFKDYNKYLSTSLKVYIFVLVLVFILKLVGMDYFGIYSSSKFIMMLDNIINKYNIANVYYILTLYIYTLFLLSLVFSKNDKKIKIICLIFTLIGILIKLIESKIALTSINSIIDISYLILMFCICNKIYKQKSLLLRIAITISLNTLYQLITIYIRNINYTNDNSIIINTILNLDYLLLLLITYKLYFMKGELKLCGMEVGLSSLKKINLKKLLKKLQRNLHKFKQLPKQERLSISIYIFLSLLWNTLSLVIILLVANLNHTFIECLFILTSFWLSKHAFGKPFHLPSMIQCFIISNLTYYTLNRITTSLGISIFIPILLGVGLSYITSKLVKKTYKKLYKGMPKELFDETILNVVDKNSVKYKICYDFYINKKSDLALSFEYNYSFAGIRKIKDRINDKIKELN